MKIIISFLIAIILSGGAGEVVYAQGQQLPYTPLEPIPGLVEGNLAQVSFPELIGTIFRIIFTLAGLLAVVMLVIGGIQYMVSDVVPLKIVGKEKIQAALFGLGILAASWLILYTINPNLLNLDLRILNNNGSDAQSPSANSGSTSGTAGGSGAPASRSFQTYASNSPIATTLMQQYPTYQLKNTAKGYALLYVNVNSNTDSTSLEAYRTFFNDCKNLGGGARAYKYPATGNVTIYGCVVPK